MEKGVPVTCVRLSILDLGHPLRGGSSMGRGRTAKAALCFAIIHLREDRTMGCERKEKFRTRFNCTNT